MKPWFYGLGVALMTLVTPFYASYAAGDDVLDELSDLSHSLLLSSAPSPHPSLQEFENQLRRSTTPLSSVQTSPFVQDIRQAIEDLNHGYEQRMDEIDKETVLGRKSPFLFSSWHHEQRFQEWERQLDQAPSLEAQQSLLEEIKKAYEQAREKEQSLGHVATPFAVPPRALYNTQKWEDEAPQTLGSPPKWAPSSPFHQKKGSPKAAAASLSPFKGFE